MYNLLGLSDEDTAETLLEATGVEMKDIPRYRDCYPSKDGSKIIIYTRVGGGNREFYEDRIEAMRAYPNYIADYDDSFDNTYASFEYKPLPEYESAVKQLAEENPETTATGEEKFKRLLTRINAVGDKQQVGGNRAPRCIIREKEEQNND